MNVDRLYTNSCIVRIQNKRIIQISVKFTLFSLSLAPLSLSLLSPPPGPRFGLSPSFLSPPLSPSHIYLISCIQINI
jgi:hypothetical protein